MKPTQLRTNQRSIDKIGTHFPQTQSSIMEVRAVKILLFKVERLRTEK
jgi:hypothetical protein